MLGDRGLFSGLEPLVYANHAGISPPSILVKKAIQTLLADYMKRGASAYPTWAAQRARLKAKLGQLVGAPEATVALTANTTRGISDLALCFPWKRGDRVVCFHGEFPSNVTPWQRAAELFGLEIVMLDADAFRTDEAGALERLKALAHVPIRVVAVSAVEFSTGHRMPLRAMSDIVRDAEGVFFVDAVQACGMTAIDVEADGIDMLSSGAHKLLMGIEGAGFVYVRETISPTLIPRVAGWLSHESPVDFLFEGPGKLRYDKPIRTSIDFLELGNVSATAFAALEASLDAILEIGRRPIFEHIQRFNDAVEGGARSLGYSSLRAEDPQARSGALCIVPPTGFEAPQVHDTLQRLGIACAVPNGHIRFSPHWPNAIDESEQVLLSLEEALGH